MRKIYFRAGPLYQISLTSEPDPDWRSLSLSPLPQVLEKLQREIGTGEKEEKKRNPNEVRMEEKCWRRKIPFEDFFLPFRD